MPRRGAERGTCFRCGNTPLKPNGQCARCWGIYRGSAQLGRLLGPAGLAALLALAEGAPPGVKCPHCALECREVAFRGWFIDVCGQCHGAYTDFGEFIEGRRRPPGAGSLFERLRALLRRKADRAGWAAPPFEQYRLIEVLSVPNEWPEKVATHHRTRRGSPYLLEASGVVSNWKLRFEGVDALYCYAQWRVGPVPEKWAQLRVDGGSLEDLAGAPLPYQPSHLYRVPFQGTGKVLGLLMSDAQASWPDNSGALTVRLYAKEA